MAVGREADTLVERDNGRVSPSPKVLDVLASLLEPNGTGVAPSLKLCEAVTAALPVTGAALSLMIPTGSAGLVAATDDRATAMEELQFSLGDGPSLVASRSGRPVMEPDLSQLPTARWPGYLPAVLDQGVRAVFAFPLQVGAIRVGVLDLYRDSAGHLPDHDFADALDFADVATMLLLHLQGQNPDEPMYPDLLETAVHRPEVHQATGMVMVQTSVTIEQAFLMLRARAFAEGRPVADLATEVVDRRVRFSREDR